MHPVSQPVRHKQLLATFHRTRGHQVQSRTVLIAVLEKAAIIVKAGDLTVNRIIGQMPKAFSLGRRQLRQDVGVAVK